MPNEHRADPNPPPHHGQGRGGSKKESFSLRVSPALTPARKTLPTSHRHGRSCPWSGDAGTKLEPINAAVQRYASRSSAVHRCARRSTEFAWGSKTIGQNRGEMKNSSVT